MTMRIKNTETKQIYIIEPVKEGDNTIYQFPEGTFEIVTDNSPDGSIKRGKGIGVTRIE